jgi:pimeloyl-ACP methyl ester carboxylesterase
MTAFVSRRLRVAAFASSLLAAAGAAPRAFAAQGGLSDFGPCPPGYDFPTPLAGRARCATLTVPESRRTPEGRVLPLPIVKFAALDADPAEPVFVLNGGPGEPNLATIRPLVEVARRHDVYYLGYRGADGPTILQCPELSSSLDAPRILSRANLERVEAAAGACARRLQQSGIDVAHYTILDVIDDLETARTALGYARIDLFSVSYGTRVAQYYARRHPERIFRSVMSGANPPGHFVFDARVNDRVLAHLSDLCAADARCASKTDNLQETVLDALHAGAKTGSDRIDDGKTQLALFLSMYRRDRFGSFVDAALAAGRGDLSGLERAGEFVSGLGKTIVWGDLMAKGILDSHGYAAKQESFAATAVSMGSPLDQLYHALTKQWPAAPLPPEYHRAADDATQTLVINGDVDVATPLTFVQAELMPHLRNGKLLVLEDYGHGDSGRQSQAIDRVVATYYDTGELDVSPLQPDPYVFGP